MNSYSPRTRLNSPARRRAIRRYWRYLDKHPHVEVPPVLIRDYNRWALGRRNSGEVGR